MSRAEARTEARARILAGAATLGASDGVGALSLQGIASASGVSKGLVLYHFGDKDGVLRAVAAHVAAADVAALRAVVGAADVLEAWRAVPRDCEAMRRRALLAALQLEPAVRAEPTDAQEAPESPEAPDTLDAPDAATPWRAARSARAARAARATAAAEIATAMLSAVGLTSRHSAAILGALVLQHLDGLAVGATRQAAGSDAQEASQDAFALALLALGD